MPGLVDTINIVFSEGENLLTHEKHYHLSINFLSNGVLVNRDAACYQFENMDEVENHFMRRIAQARNKGYVMNIQQFNIDPKPKDMESPPYKRLQMIIFEYTPSSIK